MSLQTRVLGSIALLLVLALLGVLVTAGMSRMERALLKWQ